MQNTAVRQTCCPIRAARAMAAARREQRRGPADESATTPGSGAADALSQMMESPMMQQMMARLEQNPEFLASMADQMTNTPQMRAMLEQHPEMASMLRDPEMLRQSLRMARDPALRQQMTRQQDQAMANLSNMPGGFNALARFYSEVQEPMMEAATTQATPGQAARPGDASCEGNPFATLLQRSAPPSVVSSAPDPQSAEAGPSSRAVPNPWAPPSLGGAAVSQQPPANPFQALFGSRPASSTSSHSPTASTQQQGADARGRASGAAGCGEGGGMGMCGMDPSMMLQMLECEDFQRHMAEMAADPQVGSFTRSKQVATWVGGGAGRQAGVHAQKVRRAV